MVEYTNQLFARIYSHQITVCVCLCQLCQKQLSRNSRRVYATHNIRLDPIDHGNTTPFTKLERLEQHRFCIQRIRCNTTPCDLRIYTRIPLENRKHARNTRESTRKQLRKMCTRRSFRVCDDTIDLGSWAEVFNVPRCSNRRTRRKLTLAGYTECEAAASTERGELTLGRAAKSRFGSRVQNMLGVGTALSWYGARNGVLFVS